MRGVFLTSLKLAIFHAGFTWLTLTVGTDSIIMIADDEAECALRAMYDTA